jgi:hypothetical protein
MVMTMDNKQIEKKEVVKVEKKAVAKKVVKSTKPKTHKVEGLTGLTFAGIPIVDGSVTLRREEYVYAVSMGWCK